MINVGISSVLWGCSVPWGYHEYRGVILSTVGILSTVEGYHDARGRIS